MKVDKVTGSFLYSLCFFSVPLGISQRAKHLLKKSILDWPLFLSLHIFWSFKGLLALWPFIASDYGFVSSHSDGLAEVTRSHFAARSPLKTQAHQRTYSFYFIFFSQYFRRRNHKMALVVNLTQCPCLSSTICTCRITAFIRRTDCTVDILICHSMKNTSSLSSIKSPSKSQMVTAKQNTLEESPLNGIQHSLTVPCLLWRDKMSTVRPVHHHSHFRDEFIIQASYKCFKSKSLGGHLKQSKQTQRLSENTRNNCNRWTHTGLI